MVAVIAAAALLTGCASKHLSHSNPHVNIKHVASPPENALNPESLHQVAISPTVSLHTAGIWPLAPKVNNAPQGTYLQKITAFSRGKKHAFSVHLTLEENMLESIAFSDFVGRLYLLKWTPEEVIWEGSSFVPKIIKPENILADFLLIHLPVDQLQSRLHGAQVFENVTETGKTRVIQNQEVLRTITYRTPLGAMWQNVTIDNPEAGYKLDIQTAVQ